MAKRISDCAGARVHTSLIKGKKKGENKIAWAVNYKDEGVWCNTEKELLEVLRKISMVQLHGPAYKTWEAGKEGWRKNSSTVSEE